MIIKAKKYKFYGMQLKQSLGGNLKFYMSLIEKKVEIKNQ